MQIVRPECWRVSNRSLQFYLHLLQYVWQINKLKQKSSKTAELLPFRSEHGLPVTRVLAVSGAKTHNEGS